MSTISAVLYENVLSRDLLTATIVSGEDAETFKQNTYDRYFYSFWKDSVSANPYIEFNLASAHDIDAIGIYGIEDDSLNDYTFELYGGTVTNPATLIASGSLDANICVLMSFPEETTFTFWRLVFNGPANIANVMLGKRMILESSLTTKWVRPPATDGNSYSEMYSEDGFPLGKFVSNGPKRLTLSQADMSNEFFRNTWLPFIEYAYGDIDQGDNGNFYVSWNELKYPNESVFCVSEKIPRAQSWAGATNTSGEIRMLAYGGIDENLEINKNMLWPEGDDMLWPEGENIDWEDVGS